MTIATRLLTGRLTITEWCFAGLCAVAGALLILFSYVRGQELQAVNAFIELTEISRAMKLAKLDTNCWLGRIDALVDASKGNVNSCDAKLGAKLRTPYIRAGSFRDDGAMKLISANSDAWISVTTRHVSHGLEHVLNVSPLPERLAQAIATLCVERDTQRPQCVAATADDKPPGVLWRLQ